MSTTNYMTDRLSGVAIDFPDLFNLEAATEPLPRFHITPFKIVCCVNEGIPYRFSNLRTDKSDGNRPIVVQTVTKPLYQMGRMAVEVKGQTYTKGLADYSIDGMESRVQIERKSIEDLYGTLGGRRDDFEAEICRLNYCDYAAVVIEAGWREALQQPDHSRLNPKVISRTIQSWSIRYPKVHWWTCEGRDHAESFTYRLLEMFWRHAQHEGNLNV